MGEKGPWPGLFFAWSTPSVHSIVGRVWRSKFFFTLPLCMLHTPLLFLSILETPPPLFFETLGGSRSLLVVAFCSSLLTCPSVFFHFSCGSAPPSPSVFFASEVCEMATRTTFLRRSPVVIVLVRVWTCFFFFPPPLAACTLRSWIVIYTPFLHEGDHCFFFFFLRPSPVL